MATNSSLAARVAGGEYGQRKVTAAAIELDHGRPAHFEPKEILLEATVLGETLERSAQPPSRLGEIAVPPSR